MGTAQKILSALSGFTCLISVLACSPITLPDEKDVEIVSCENYCMKITDACQQENPQYNSPAHCLEYCVNNASYPIGRKTLHKDDVPDEKNTLICRQYHAGVAVGDPKTHCEHAGPTGGNVCGSLCKNYCDLMNKNCVSIPKCLEVCEDSNLNRGAPNDPFGDTIDCRITYAGFAGSKEIRSNQLDCQHANLISSTMCVP